MLSLWSPNIIVVIIVMSLGRYCSHTILLLDDPRKIADIPEIDRDHVGTHPEIVRTGGDSFLQYAPFVQTFGIPQLREAKSRAGKVVDEEKLHGGIPASNNLAGLVVGQQSMDASRGICRLDCVPMEGVHHFGTNWSRPAIWTYDNMHCVFYLLRKEERQIMRLMRLNIQTIVQ